MNVEFELLGFPDAGPTLVLDHERFAYAGNFRRSATGKAVARDLEASTGSDEHGSEEPVVGATAFDEDRAHANRAKIRYVTVRSDRHGERIGPRLLRFTAERLCERFGAVAIAVNNPAAYLACYRAGFVSTGRETGIAELRMRYDPGEASVASYREGWSVFEGRDLPERQHGVLERHADGEPPPVLEAP